METLKAKRKLTSAFPSSTARSPASASRKVNSIINFIKSAEQSHSNAPTATYSQSIGSSSSKKSSAPVIVLDSDEEPECRETTNTYNSSNQASTGFIHQEVISLLDEEDDDDEKVQLPPSNTVLSNPTIEVDDVQIAKVEEVAIIPRSVTFPSKPVLDSNMDVEADDGLDQQLGSSHALCLVCDSDLSQLTEDLKELHLQQCLDTVLPPSHDGDHVESDRLDQAEAKENDTTSTANVDDAQRGLRNKFFFCVLCDMELSGRRLLYRCLHLKKCAREKGMSTKQLLQHISPVGEYGEEENEDELDDELEEELEEEAEGHHDRAESKEVASTSSGKNAFSFLMASAKEQASMKGMFEYREKTIKAPVATATVATTTTATKGRKSNATTKKAALSSDGTTSTNNRWMYAKKKPNGNQSNPGYAPAYKKIQIGNMTYPIVVDGFQYSSSLLSDTYFLTHFHSDHYIGLSKDFNCGKTHLAILIVLLL